MVDVREPNAMDNWARYNFGRIVWVLCEEGISFGSAEPSELFPDKLKESAVLCVYYRCDERVKYSEVYAVLDKVLDFRKRWVCYDVCRLFPEGTAFV